MSLELVSSTNNNFKEKYQELIKKIKLKTNLECLIQRTNINNGSEYYKCDEFEDHVYLRSIFDTWMQQKNGNSNCILCFKSLNLNNVYINE